MIESGVILRVGSKYFHFTDLGCSLYLRMQRMSFLLRSGTEVNTPRAITSRSILANHSSTWLSHDEQVGVKGIRKFGCSLRNASPSWVLCAERLSTMTWISLPRG